MCISQVIANKYKWSHIETHMSKAKILFKSISSLGRTNHKTGPSGLFGAADVGCAFNITCIWNGQSWLGLGIAFDFQNQFNLIHEVPIQFELILIWLGILQLPYNILLRHERNNQINNVVNDFFFCFFLQWVNVFRVNFWPELLTFL